MWMCINESRDSETFNFWITFLKRFFYVFFEMSLQKNVKSHVFWIFKKRKKRILEL